MRENPDGGPLRPLAILDTGWTRRSVTTLLCAASAFAGVWLLVADASPNARVSSVVVIGCALTLAAVIAALRPDTPRVLNVALLGGAVVVTAQAAVAGAASSPFLLFYAWLIPYAFLLWSVRVATAYVLALAAAAATLMAVDGADRSAVAAWLIGLGGAVAVGWVVRTICRGLVERNQAACRAARSQTLLTGFARTALAELDVERSLADEASAVVRAAIDADHVEVLRVEGETLVTAGTAGRWTPARRPEEVLEVQIGDAGAPIGQVRAVRVSSPFEEAEAVFVGGVADVLAVATRRAAAERTRRDEAGRDALTGLPGRERFADALAGLVPVGGTLMLLDVDGFGLVNETLGPRAGDMLLRSVAQRLSASLDAGVTLARVGGDELALFDPATSTELAALALAGQVQDVIARPFDLDGAQHHVSVGVGIVVCTPGAYADDRAALRDAHVAQRRAKERGRGRRELFSEEVRAGLDERRALEQDLRRALARNEFRLVFQPVVSLDDDRVVGAETLVRWEHPTRGVVGPNEFIPVAEASDLIVPLGAWILREAFRQLKAWDASGSGFEGFRLSVNLSGRQLMDPGFVAHVQRLLQMHDLDPARIVFELTETALADESADVEQAFEDLRRLGVGLALDDFGTGYASLSYVRRFAFDSLKLDRSFVAGLGGEPQDAALITAAISMGHAMHMNVVAEGVETPEQVAALREMGCGLAQGYLFGRPVGPGALRTMIRGAAERDARARS